SPAMCSITNSSAFLYLRPVPTVPAVPNVPYFAQAIKLVRCSTRSIIRGPCRLQRRSEAAHLIERVLQSVAHFGDRLRPFFSRRSGVASRRDDQDRAARMAHDLFGHAA